ESVGIGSYRLSLGCSVVSWPGSHAAVVHEPPVAHISLDLSKQSKLFGPAVGNLDQHTCVLIDLPAKHFCKNIVRYQGHLQRPAVAVVGGLHPILGVVSIEGILTALRVHSEVHCPRNVPGRPPPFFSNKSNMDLLKTKFHFVRHLVNLLSIEYRKQ